MIMPAASKEKCRLPIKQTIQDISQISQTSKLHHNIMKKHNLMSQHKGHAHIIQEKPRIGIQANTNMLDIEHYRNKK